MVAKGKDTNTMAILVHLSQCSAFPFLCPRHVNTCIWLTNFWHLAVMKNSAASMSPNHDEWVATSRTLSNDGIQNMGAHKASLSTEAVKSYTSLISSSPFSTYNKAVKLRTVPPKMWCRLRTLSTFFFFVTNSSISLGTCSLLVNLGNLPLIKISYPYRNSFMISLG